MNTGDRKIRMRQGIKTRKESMPVESQRAPSLVTVHIFDDEGKVYAKSKAEL
jgi:hypothetical protein